MSFVYISLSWHQRTPPIPIPTITFPRNTPQPLQALSLLLLLSTSYFFYPCSVPALDFLSSFALFPLILLLLLIFHPVSINRRFPPIPSTCLAWLLSPQRKLALVCYLPYRKRIPGHSMDIANISFFSVIAAGPYVSCIAYLPANLPWGSIGSTTKTRHKQHIHIHIHIHKPHITHTHTSIQYQQSQAIRANGQIFVSGQIPADASANLVEGSIGDKTQACCDNIKAILDAAGSNVQRIVKVNVCFIPPPGFEWAVWLY